MMIINKIRAVIKNMNEDKDLMRVIYSSAQSQGEMRSAINDWALIYENSPPWDSKTLRKLNLGKAIAKELARLVLLEAEFKSTDRNIDAFLQSLLSEIRPHFEKALAKGGMAIKPYVSGDKIKTDYVDAENFFPTDYDQSGEITGAVFRTRLSQNGKFYTRLEKHTFDGSSEEITHAAYESSSRDMLGGRVPLEKITAWKGIAPHSVIRNISAPLFAYFKVPFANTIDDSSPLGVSAYEEAIDLLEDADKQYTSLLWEYEGGELAIDADIDTLMGGDDYTEFSLPHGKKRLFRRCEGFKANGEPFYHEFAPNLRDKAYTDGLETILRRVEFASSLAYGTLSNVQNVDKTAEEIRSSKQRSYAAVSELQKTLGYAVERAAAAAAVWLNILGIKTDENSKVTFMWDDSIVRDPTREFSERLQLISAGAYQPYEMRAWYFGEDENEARKRCADEDDVEDIE